MPNRFVLDASLFEKYRIDRPTNPTDEISFEEVIIELSNKGKLKNSFEELSSLKHILREVNNKKAKIWYNKEVIEQYLFYKDKVPTVIRRLLISVLSDDDCSVEMGAEVIGFLEEDYNEIQDDNLKEKEVYLDLAKALKRRVIVSTLDDIIDVYNKPPNSDILFKHKIRCNCTCEYLKSLEPNA